ncbi:mechanosensitive ion channel domain-containing protein [Devosia sp. RR2S18]|uniref:mechanosensitive ion channel domain-containing protein n=1 Tax=Devosia rhizosphaerae TaxID=3049774 RepID=UPI00254000DA|nr:mechanosensitive ion channel domain-containing protein [Devosia sp. RR2S18]WIJ25688.1 mechanosensitive ion channel [Devosia sp. RR2S18]
MRFLAVLLLALFSLTTIAQAQIPGLNLSGEEEPAPAASDAGINELITIIENEETRADLLERLRAVGAPLEPAEEVVDLSIARQLAEYTQAIAEGASDAVVATGVFFGEVQDGLSGSLGADYAVLGNLALNLLMVGAALFLSFFLLRLLVAWAELPLATRAAGRGSLARTGFAIGAGLLELGAVLLAWAAGYVIALYVLGNSFGRIGINQTLLLNAFLVVELIKVAMRVVLSPRFPTLRLLPVGDNNAAYWSFWLGRMISLIGYTFMFVAPVVAANLSEVLSDGIKVLVMVTAVAIGILIVLQSKDGVRLWLNGLAAKRENRGFGQALVLLGRYWHGIAILYLVALLVLWFANPETALPFMIAATMQSLIAILVGAAVVGFISRFLGVGLHLPEDVKERLPLLEPRLHTFVPKVMQVVQWTVIVLVALAILQAWSLFNFLGWISSPAGLQVVGAVVSAALIVLACIIVYVVVASWIEYRLNPNFGKVPTAREKTLLSLFKNAFTVALIVFGAMLALAQIGVNIAPLLAGAGVVGLAIGFGAQKLVQDIITGIFIQLENIMNEGDVVAVGDKTGVVEKLTIRSVTIRDLGGTVHLIPFSSVDQVSNMVRGFSFHIAEIGVAYDSDIDQVKQALRDAFERLMQSEHKEEIIDELDVHGVTAFGDSAIMVRVRIKTLPGSHWAVGRAYNEIVKTVFEEQGIEIPYPHVTYVAPPQREKRGGKPSLPDSAPQAG